MPRRRTIIATGQFYHIFNKSVAAENIFTRARTISRVLSLIDFYRFPVQISYSLYNSLSANLKNIRQKAIYSSAPVVLILAFAIMPSHYHFLVKQLVDGGISSFISNFQNSFAKFYNIKYKREGSVFKARFKAVRIESEEQLVHVSRYIHLNPVTSYLLDIEELGQYSRTSFTTYMNNKVYKLVETETIMRQFNNKRDLYGKFVQDQSDYQRKLHEIKSLTFD
ncbi:MAG: transposase [Candidatus Paceibacterota bacterium]